MRATALPTASLTASTLPAPALTTTVAVTALTVNVLDLFRIKTLTRPLRTRQTARDVGVDPQILKEVLRRVVGFHRFHDVKVQRAGNQAPPRHIVPVHKRNGRALCSGARRAADPVQVCFLIFWALVVHDVGNVLNVDAAGSHIRCDEDVDLALLERTQRTFTSALPQIPVQRAHRETTPLQIIGEGGRGPLGLHEHDRSPSPLRLQNARQNFRFVEGVRAVGELVNLGDRCALVIRILGTNVGGLTHETTRQRDDRARHGRGEEHGVPAARHLRQEPLHVGEEAQVQHLIGLIQHHRVHVVELEDSAVGQVDEAPGRAHHDLHPLLQCLHLRLKSHATVDVHDARRQVLRRDTQIVRNLLTQLAGRQNDQGLWGAGGEEVVKTVLTGCHHVFEDRDAKPQSLTRTRFCLANDVPASQRHGQGQGLDWKRMSDPLRIQCVNNFAADTKVRKSLFFCAHYSPSEFSTSLEAADRAYSLSASVKESNSPGPASPGDRATFTKPVYGRRGGHCDVLIGFRYD